ncbi:hypothetical protein Tco_0880360, partial [Tanacetum coccineum]
MTTPASIIGDTRMDSSLEIVYMLRRYELMRDSRRIVAPSPREETSMRQDEFFSMMKAFKYSPEDRLWGTLRDINMICRAKYFNPMRRLKSTSTKAPSSPQDEKDNKWRLQTEVMKLFNQALKDAFPEFTEKCMMLWLPRDDHFQCDNVIDIWPKIKKSKSNSYPDIEGPKDVGKRIKDTLVKQKSHMKPNSDVKQRSHMKLKSHMIEGDPWVYGVGFVAIKLSGNWMAE